MFEITRTIYSNSESSELFLKQNAFLTFYWSFLRSNTIEQFSFKLERTNIKEKLENELSYPEPWFPIDSILLGRFHFF